MPKRAPKAGYMNYSEEEKPFALLHEVVWKKNSRKEKVGGDLEIWAVILPIVVITLWMVTAGIIWGNGYELSGFLSYFSLILFSLSMLATVGLITASTWGGIEVQKHKVAKKIFTKQNLEESTENLLYNYRHANESVQKILRTKLGVTPEEVEYMNTLVHEGYAGSIKDLVTIVRKL